MAATFRILFVCHGNICRSPMAEFVLKDMVEQRGIARLFTIASAATHNDEIGSGVHAGTRSVLEKHSIACEGHRARRLRGQDAEEWDMLIGMDEANVRDIRRQLGRGVAGRTYKLLSFAGSDRDVADPWYTRDFETTYDDVEAGCAGLLAWLEGELRRAQGKGF